MIKAPATAASEAAADALGWRVQTMVTLDASATVTVRLIVGTRTIAQVTRNVSDGRTPLYLTIPRGYRRKGTFALALKVSGSAAQSAAALKVR